MEDRENLVIVAKSVKTALLDTSKTDIGFLRTYLVNETARLDLNTALELAEKSSSKNIAANSKSFNLAVSTFQKAQRDLKSKPYETLLNCVNNLQATVLLFLFWILDEYGYCHGCP